MNAPIICPSCRKVPSSRDGYKNPFADMKDHISVHHPGIDFKVQKLDETTEIISSEDHNLLRSIMEVFE